MSLDPKIDLLTKMAKQYFSKKETSTPAYSISINKATHPNPPYEYWAVRLLEYKSGKWENTGFFRILKLSAVRENGPEECVDYLIEDVKKEMLNKIKNFKEFLPEEEPNELGE